MKTSLIFIMLMLSFGLAQSLKVTYNTTLVDQFRGEYAFERLDQVRVIFRAEPVTVVPGQSTSLNFAIENPMSEPHRVGIKLIEVPLVFEATGPEEVVKTVEGKSIENASFELRSKVGAAPRSYWYAFDVVDETIGPDKGVVNTSKMLGTFGGLNIVESVPPESEVIEKPEEVNYFYYIGIAGLVIATALLFYLFRGRFKV